MGRVGQHLAAGPSGMSMVSYGPSGSGASAPASMPGADRLSATPISLTRPAQGLNGIHPAGARLPGRLRMRVVK